MLKTSTFDMVLPTNDDLNSVFTLSNRKLEKKRVYIPTPVRDDQSEDDILIIGNEKTESLTGTFENVPPFKVRKQWKSYPFSIENSIIAFNEMTIGEPRELNLMSFDIEVGTNGGQPTPAQHKILTIGYCINDEPPEVLYIENAGASDENVIKEFIRVIKDRHVDVLATYYGSGFDIPYIIRRAYCLGMTDEVMKLCGNNEYLKTLMNNVIYHEADLYSEFGFILHHDLYEEVMKDQSLFKIKHRTLKNVGRYFFKDTDVRELDHKEIINMIDLYRTDPQKIIEYQASDANITQRLAQEIYTKRAIDMANEMQIPLNIMFRRTSTMLLQVELLRRMVDRNIFISCKNHIRFAPMYERSIRKGSKKPYQGAWTEAFKRGKHDEVHKYDYAGLYPSIIMTLNLSYETVELVEMKEHMEGTDRDIEVKMDIDPDYRIITLNDANQQSTITLRVRVKPIGFISGLLTDLKNRRKDIKNRMNKIDKDKPEYTELDSSQQMVKVLMNSMYGLLSNRDMPGWLPAGMLTTAMGRHIAGKLIDILKEEISEECILELDTDGVIVSGKANIDNVNEKIIQYVEEKFQIPRDTISIFVEEEEFDRIFIHKSKNYILRDKEGDVIVHGSALKSSRLPKVVDQAIDLVIEYGIKDTITKEELLEKAMDLEKEPLESFIMSQRLTKEPEKYNTPTEIIKAAKALADENIIEVTKGTKLEYVMMTDKLSGSSRVTPIQKIRKDDVIDHEHYKRMIRTLLNEMELISKPEEKHVMKSLIW